MLLASCLMRRGARGAWTLGSMPRVGLSTSTQPPTEEAVPLEVTVKNNLACFTLPMPSGSRTVFQLPLHTSIRELDAEVRAEDKALTSVRLFSETGDAVASGTPLGVALQLPCRLLINTQLFALPAIPAPEGAPSSTPVLQDHHLHQVLARAAAVLEAADADQQRRKQALHRLQELEDALAPLNEKRLAVEAKGMRIGHRQAWMGLGVMGMQFGFLARLTWWEYSWDIMEPVTYFVGYGTTMLLFAYFVLTRQDLSGPSFTERKMRLVFEKVAAKHGLDIKEYNRLVDEIIKAETELRSMQ